MSRLPVTLLAIVVELLATSRAGGWRWRRRVPRPRRAGSVVRVWLALSLLSGPAASVVQLARDAASLPIVGRAAASVGGALAATGWLSQAASAQQGDATTVVPWLSSGYKYQQVAWGAAAGFEPPGYDDSAFPTGAAGFGTQSSPVFRCPLSNPTDAKAVWNVNTDILVRKSFTLPAGSANLQVYVAIDNDATVWLNGTQIGSYGNRDCGRRHNTVFTAPASVLVSGTNVLAIRGHDFGGDAYLDVLVTATFAGPSVQPSPVGTNFSAPLLNGQVSPDPVHTYTSAFLYSRTDVALAGRGPTPARQT